MGSVPWPFFDVTPAQAGVQIINDILDSGLRRNDGLLPLEEGFQQLVNMSLGLQ